MSVACGRDKLLAEPELRQEVFAMLLKALLRESRSQECEWRRDFSALATLE
jgi:hypothetical protein